MQSAFLALAISALAVSPGLAQMNYQGRLTDSSGNNLTPGQYTIEFRLFDEAGAEKWGPFTTDGTAGNGKGPQVDLVDGRFNTVIGNLDAGGRALSSAFNGTDKRFLQIKVGNNPAITPRQLLLPAPIAHYAVKADTVSIGAIGTNQLANLAVTGDKIANNTISVAKLTGAGANFWDGNGTNVWRTGGNVGIGTSTPAAIAKLDVSGGYTFLDGLRISGLDTGNTIYQATGDIGINTAQPSQSVKIGSFAGGTALTVTGGNVGIGTTSPSQILHVQTPGAQTGRIQVGGTAAGSDSKIISFGDGDLVTIGESGADDRMVLKANKFHFNVGNVGIGTNDPRVKLDVIGSSNLTMIDNGYSSHAFSQSGTTWTATGFVFGSGRGIETYGMDGVGYYPDGHTLICPVGIRADGWIATARGLIVYSDRRIKRDMQASATAKDLATIQQLQVTDYRMVDPADGGMAWRKGFIAQEVEKVMPLAVTRGTEFVPDIFSVATTVAYDPAAKTLALTLAKDHDLKMGDRVRLHIDGKREDLNVSAVPSAREFVVEQCENTPEKVLVYGKQVNDFRNVDYDHIYTVSVGAIQELARKVETHEVECTELREVNAALSARVAALEAKDEARDTKLTAIEALLTRDAAKTVPISLNR